jgi:hypothetical protein
MLKFCFSLLRSCDFLKLDSNLSIHLIFGATRETKRSIISLSFASKILLTQREWVIDILHFSFPLMVGSDLFRWSHRTEISQVFWPFILTCEFLSGVGFRFRQLSQSAIGYALFGGAWRGSHEQLLQRNCTWAISPVFQITQDTPIASSECSRS